MFNAISSTMVGEQFEFVDAAVETGVKRYMPSEYGLDDSRPEARALNAVFDEKAKLQEYHKSKEATGLTWHAIGCGMWIDCLDYASRTITLAGSGMSKFSTITMSNTGLALNHCHLSPGLSKNQTVYNSDFAISQEELVAKFERASGETWANKSYNSARAIEEYQAKCAAGDHLAVYKMIETEFVSSKYGGYDRWIEEKEGLWNEVLNLPAAALDEFVRHAM